MNFVIFYHYNISEPHYDLMLEADDTLDTWRIPELHLDSLLGGDEIEVISIHGHNKKYLDYEGELSSGNGTVQIYDKGTTSYTRFDTPEFEVMIFGLKISGRLIFKKIEDSQYYLKFIRILNSSGDFENIS